jgi:hypothetical protein
LHALTLRSNVERRQARKRLVVVMVENQMRGWSALTPALSPRRGSAASVAGRIKNKAAFGATWKVGTRKES